MHSVSINKTYSKLYAPKREIACNDDTLTVQGWEARLLLQRIVKTDAGSPKKVAELFRKGNIEEKTGPRG